MQPSDYCEQRRKKLKATGVRGPLTQARLQVRIVLSYYVNRKPTVEVFEAELAALAHRAEQQGKLRLAKAAAEILADWQAWQVNTDQRKDEAGPENRP
jgi:hypothetical protein